MKTIGAQVQNLGERRKSYILDRVAMLDTLATLSIRSHATKIEMQAIFSKNLMKNMCLLQSTESIK